MGADRSIRCGIFVAVALLSVACMAQAGDQAELNRSLLIGDKTGHRKYIVEGSHVTAKIVETYVPSGITSIRNNVVDEDCPVFFSHERIFPNPFSQPTALIAVMEKSDFRIEIFVGGEEAADTFDFIGVEEGVYLFPFPSEMWPRAQASVVLISGGKVVDTLPIPFR